MLARSLRNLCLSVLLLIRGFVHEGSEFMRSLAYVVEGNGRFLLQIWLFTFPNIGGGFFFFFVYIDISRSHDDDDW